MTDEKLIRDVINKINLPEEILSVDFSFSEDSTGMPAVWINLHILDDYKPSAEKISKLSALMRDISRKILDTDVISWPYVRFVTD
nr:hypothetical protein [uncultured Duganella sp.]